MSGYTYTPIVVSWKLDGLFMSLLKNRVQRDNEDTLRFPGVTV